MKKLCLLTAATSLLMLAACTEQLDAPELVNGTDQSSDNAVSFTTNIGKSKATRAGYEGNLTTASLGDPTLGNGFGVIAYYTGKANYKNDQPRWPSSYKGNRWPTFMYNTQVLWEGAGHAGEVGATGDGKWTYSPLKYWPNEVTDQDVDDQNNDQNDDPAQATGNYGGNVTFFAYGPYVDVYQKKADAWYGATAYSHGDVTDRTSYNTWRNDANVKGIISLSGNKYASDPYIGYKLTSDGKNVDLLWGTKGNTSVNVNDKENVGVQGDGNRLNDILYDTEPEGLKNPKSYSEEILERYAVNANLTKQKTTGTIEFLFKHATSKVGGSYIGEFRGDDEDPKTPTNGLMIVLDLDDMKGAEKGGKLEDFGDGATERTKYKTKVTVKNIKITSDRKVDHIPGVKKALDGVEFESDYVTIKSVDFKEIGTWAPENSLQNYGCFDLATGQWSDHARTTDFKGINHIIVSPGTDNSTDEELLDNQSATLSDEIAEPKEPSAKNKQFFTETLPIGVTTVQKNVYKDEANPLVFFPNTYPVLEIEIEYLVRTYDEKMAYGYSEVAQKIKKRLVFMQPTQLNKAYNVLIHLGLTGVKFTATVSDWDITTTTTTTSDPQTGETVEVMDADMDVWTPINVEGTVTDLILKNLYTYTTVNSDWTPDDMGAETYNTKYGTSYTGRAWHTNALPSQGVNDVNRMVLAAGATYVTEENSKEQFVDVTKNVAYTAVDTTDPDNEVTASWVHISSDGRVELDDNNNFKNRTARITATYNDKEASINITQSGLVVNTLTLTIDNATHTNGLAATENYSVKAKVQDIISGKVRKDNLDVTAQAAPLTSNNTDEAHKWVDFDLDNGKMTLASNKDLENRSVDVTAKFYGVESNKVTVSQKRSELKDIANGVNKYSILKLQKTVGETETTANVEAAGITAGIAGATFRIVNLKAQFGKQENGFTEDVTKTAKFASDDLPSWMTISGNGKTLTVKPNTTSKGDLKKDIKVTFTDLDGTDRDLKLTVKQLGINAIVFKTVSLNGTALGHGDILDISYAAQTINVKVIATFKDNDSGKYDADVTNRIKSKLDNSSSNLSTKDKAEYEKWLTKTNEYTYKATKNTSAGRDNRKTAIDVTLEVDHVKAKNASLSQDFTRVFVRQAQEK